MIDTLRLNLIDCEIKRSCPLTIQTGLKDYSTGKLYNENDLFIDASGMIIRGAKAYLNDEKFNLTIQPTIESEKNDFNQNKLKIKRFHRIDEKIQPDLYDWEEEDEVKGIFLQTSLPRLLNEHNLKTLSFDEQKKALKILEDRLRIKGIKTNIENANLSRLDTFTNIKTEFPFHNYSDLFSLMECSRMKSVGYGQESFLWKNGNQELMIYDKKKELTDKNPKLKFHNSINILRLENRLLKKRKILSSIKFKTVSELYKNYDELKFYHTKEIEKKIFKYSFNEIERLTTNRIDASSIYCKNQFDKSWLNQLFMIEGARGFSKVMDNNFLFDLIEKRDQEKSDLALRKKKSRAKKMFQDLLFHGTMLDNLLKEGNFKTNVQLYDELKIKFYKEVA